jgi:hypothetical protein
MNLTKKFPMLLFPDRIDSPLSSPDAPSNN